MTDRESLEQIIDRLTAEVERLRDVVREAFIAGGQWSDMFMAWNAESSSLDLDNALKNRADLYVADLTTHEQRLNK